MRIAVTSEYHFRRGPDGVYTDAAYPYEVWAALHDVFDEVVVIARVGDAPIGPTCRRADGAGVRFAEVRDFVSVRGLARGGVPLARAALAAVRATDVLIVHAPGIIASAGHAAALVCGRPYAIEVVGDPRQSLAGAGRVVARLADAGAVLLRAQVRGAVASCYVTERALQEQYPPPPGRFTSATSDVELPEAIFTEPPIAISEDGVLDVIFVGPLARPYKGVDVLLDAMTRTVRPHRLTIVGDGVLRAGFTADAAARGLADRVTFTGMLPTGAPVFARLRAADLFVLPSRTEGLPRSLIEAMAVGLPCLATPVGGIPELLAEDALVPVGDAAALARAIDALAAAPDRRRALAAANRQRASIYRTSVRRLRMAAYYRAIAEAARARV